MTSPYVLELNNVGRQYGTEPAVHALVDVDLCVAPGEWLAITGPSGAGKSTLLHILGCLDRPTSGTYLFEGLNTAKLNDRQRAGLRSRRIGFVFQSFHLLPHRSVLENVMLAEVYRRQSHRGRRERALAALERVGLSHRVDYLPTKLSGGERQRVAVARALVGSPSLLLCDEPTGNLDSKTAASLLDLFEELNRQGLTLVVVTHDENVANRAGRRVHIIDGQLTDITAARKLTEAQELEAMGQGVGRDESVTGGQTPEDHRSSPASGPSAHTPVRPPRSGMSLRDLFEEAIAGMFARPARMALTILGIVIGLTALVATVGLSRTANNRIVSEFDELVATEMIITPRTGSGGIDPKTIPWDAADRLMRLNGVAAAGTLSEVNVGDSLVSASAVRDPQGQTAFNLAVKAASPGLFEAVRATLAAGRFPDIGHSERLDRVAVLGPTAAQRLKIVDLSQLPAIAIGDHLYLVIGVLSDVGRQPDLLGSVIIPEGVARRDFGLAGPGAVMVETELGAASLIAQQTPLALRPDNPNTLRIQLPPEPRRVRDAVQNDLNVMFLLLGGLSLIVGAIGIGNITLVSVMERTGEIGLRRAIGANRGHIAAQFLLESASMGIIGGVLGASLGLLIVVGVSAYQVWTPVLDPSVPFLAPVVGGTIGLLSGTYPALRAARLEPVEAFRN
ncbi:ATP-binding cassette domain-containing protein [Promineifilum sp.]|uniref:ABC transporter ATP-binding protein/permease n=1 Tax=Promineifilum sp. TaxID=2664178 RepID=UPI0035AFA696